MHGNLSRLARIIIIVNIILSLAVMISSVDRFVKMNETHEKIMTYMEIHEVNREQAIYQLQEQGVTLYLGDEFFIMYCLWMPLISIYLLLKFARNNNFAAGLFAAFTGVFTTFIGGFLLFFVILSNRSQVSMAPKAYVYRDDWTHFIHKRSGDCGGDYGNVEKVRRLS